MITKIIDNFFEYLTLFAYVMGWEKKKTDQTRT